MATKEPGAIRKSTPTEEAYESPTATVRTDRSRVRNTEAGMTEAQKRAVLQWEDSHKNGRKEVFAVVDENGTINPLGNPMMQGRFRGRGANRLFVPDRDASGNIVYAKEGSRSEVAVDGRRLPQNGIFIHNHPDASKTSGISGGVGISLSSDDLRTTIRRNGREIRARAKNYIYSVKRPAGGWNADPNRVYAEWNSIYRREVESIANTYKLNVYRGKASPNDNLLYTDRINALASHRATKAMAEKYGWKYTRRRA